jgi:hypothetical protein
MSNLLIDRFLGKDMINEMETWERDKTTGKCKARGPNHTIDPLRYFIWYWQVLARRGDIPPDEAPVTSNEPKFLTEGQLLARTTFAEQEAIYQRSIDSSNIIDIEGNYGGDQ